MKTKPVRGNTTAALLQIGKVNEEKCKKNAALFWIWNHNPKRGNTIAALLQKVKAKPEKGAQ